MEETAVPEAVPAKAAPPKPEADKDQKAKLILAVVIGVLAIAAIGVGIYWMVSDKEGVLYNSLGGSSQGTGSDVDVAEGTGAATGEGEEVSDDDAEEDPYESWSTYTDETCDYTVKYPSDWQVNAVSGAGYGDVTFSKDNYVWNLDYDPIVTGGGFGYMMGEPVPASTETQTTVTPDTYTATMLTKYITKQDILNSGASGVNETFGFTGEVWEGTVLFTDVDNYDFGFGPGELNNQTDCDYFGILYLYDSQAAKYTDIPAKGDATLNQMLTTMDLITNSFDL